MASSAYALHGFVEGSAGIRRHRVLACSEQPVNGLPRNLSVDVPKADIYGTDDLRGHGAIQFPQLPPDAPNILGVVTDHHRFDELDQAGRVVIPADMGRPDKGVAADSGIGIHGDNAELLVAARFGADARHPRLGVPVEQIYFDVCYFHRLSVLETLRMILHDPVRYES